MAGNAVLGPELASPGSCILTFACGVPAGTVGKAPVLSTCGINDNALSLGSSPSFSCSASVLDTDAVPIVPAGDAVRNMEGGAVGVLIDMVELAFGIGKCDEAEMKYPGGEPL
eukprot:TRINITY_DN15076_c0_g1_i2.p2 TRINITY_DN15076_c0_g1~~TRINITY_DN15076_c0_g1_i2.p2  ORF type:complete len:113 (+),score=1.61 TRINITY_DN15076_c0_g1_i2:152-490(+)